MPKFITVPLFNLLLFASFLLFLKCLYDDQNNSLFIWSLEENDVSSRIVLSYFYFVALK